jgi:conjugal transfer mating pair stabilization protein TraG
MEGYVYGGLELYRDMFNAIAIMAGLSVIESLIRVVLLLGLVIVVAQAAFNQRPAAILQWFISAFAIFSLTIVPKTTVVIHDRLSTGAPAVVDNVPLAVGLVFSIASTAGDRATQSMETAFGDPDIAQFSGHGMVFGSRIMMELNRVQWMDETYNTNMQSFVSNCVYYELLDGTYSMDALRNSTELLAFLTSDNPPNPARSAPMLDGSGVETIVDCPTLGTDLASTAEAVAERTEQLMARDLLPDQPDALALAMIRVDVEGAHQLLIDESRSSTDIFVQAMMINSMREGMDTFAAQAGVETSGYATTRASLQTRNTNLFSAELAHKWIPYLKIVLELIFYGMFPLVAPFFLLPNFGWSLIRSYFGGFIMLQAWPPLFVIMNKIMITGAITQSQAAAFDVAAGGDATSLTLFNMDGIATVNADIASIAGFMMSLTPVIASTLAFGVDKLASQSESLLSTVRSGAQDAARAETTGEMSLGSTSFNTHRANQTFANQHHTSSSIDEGQLSEILPGGGRVVHTANGREVYDGNGAMSNTGIPVSMSRAVGAELSQMSSELRDYSRTQSEAASQSYQSGMNELWSWAQTDSAGLMTAAEQRFGDNAQAMQAVGRLIEMASASSHSEGSRVSDDRATQLSARGEVIGEASVGGSIGFASGRVTGRGTGSASWSGTDTESTSEEFSNSLSAADRETYNTSMDQVLSAMASSQVSQTGGTQNSRVNSIQQDVRQSEDYQTRADRALRQSEQASEQARRYESDSFRYDAPLHDQLLEFYGNQVGGHGQLNRSMQGWQGGLNEMYHMDRVGFDNLVEDFAATLMPRIEAWDSVQTSVGGQDLAGYSGQIGAGRSLGEYAGTALDESSMNIQGMAVGPSEEVQARTETGIAQVRGTTDLIDAKGAQTMEAVEGRQAPDINYSDMADRVGDRRENNDAGRAAPTQDELRMMLEDREGSRPIDETNDREVRLPRFG